MEKTPRIISEFSKAERCKINIKIECTYMLAVKKKKYTKIKNTKLPPERKTLGCKSNKTCAELVC